MSSVTRHVLSNGMVVLLKEVHSAPIMSWWVLYRIGSRNERTGTTGISHWVEHMMFKGTDQFPAGMLDKAIDRVGGSWNAQTFLDYTAYYETLPAAEIDLALRLGSRPHDQRQVRPRRSRIRADGDHLRAAGVGKLADVLAGRGSAGGGLPRAWLSPRDHRRHDRPAHHDPRRPLQPLQAALRAQQRDCRRGRRFRQRRDCWRGSRNSTSRSRRRSRNRCSCAPNRSRWASAACASSAPARPPSSRSAIASRQPPTPTGSSSN